MAAAVAAVHGPKVLAPAISVLQSHGMCTFSLSLAVSKSCEWSGFVLSCEGARLGAAGALRGTSGLTWSKKQTSEASPGAASEL